VLGVASLINENLRSFTGVDLGPEDADTTEAVWFDVSGGGCWLKSVWTRWSNRAAAYAFSSTDGRTDEGLQMGDGGALELALFRKIAHVILSHLDTNATKAP
jgi:hypothetical protein